MFRSKFEEMMITEEFEFLISQFADGTLDAGQTVAARVRIESDPAARAMLDEFRRIDRLLAEAAPLPLVDFTRVRAGIADAIDTEAPAVVGRIGPGSGSFFGSAASSWKMWSSLAAAVIICVTVGSVMHKSTVVSTPVARGGGRQIAPSEIARVPTADPIVVAGPAVESPTGKPVEVITVGPSPAYAARNSVWQYADDGVMVHPSSVRIAAATPRARPKPH